MADDDPQRDELREQRLAGAAEDERRASRERTLKLSLLVGLTAILAVVVLIVVSQSGDEGGDTDISSNRLSQLAGLQQQGDTIGDPAAPVTIVEFADLQCPVCKAYSEQVIPALLAGPVKAGEARLQFRNWVIIGPDSLTAAKAALAAGEQDRMWDFVTVFYENQGTENGGYVTEDFLRGIAEPAGLDIARWEQDRADPRWDSELEAVDRQAERAGADGTPSILVIGPGGESLLPGVPPAGEVEAAVAELGGQ